MCDSKKCSKCGEVKSLHLFNKDKSRKNGRYPTCKECRAVIRKKNSKYYKTYQKEYAKINQKKLKEYQRIWREKNKEYLREQDKIKTKKYKENGKAKKYKKKHIESLSDAYIKSHLSDLGFDYKSIRPELIHIKRAQILIYREIHSK